MPTSLNYYNKNNSSTSTYQQELADHYRSGFKSLTLTENHVPTDMTTPNYNDPGYHDEDFQGVGIYTKFKNIATTIGKTNPIDSGERDNLKGNKQPRDANNCLKRATKSINVNEGRFRTITSLLCKSCLIIFKIKNENVNQFDCFGSNQRRIRLNLWSVPKG